VSSFLAAPSDDAHHAGDRVGRWELVRCIGVGGMGSVWEAHHESLKRRVAIKFINLAHADDDDARMRFEAEAKAASALHSRHVVEMFDHGRTDRGEPFIVMEYLVGESLEARLQREGRLSLAATAAVVVQVARALQQAHDLGIVHRDLKPDNIYLAPDEEPGMFVAKVLDFGVAKLTGASAVLSDAKTKTGSLMGTPYYMAPEQARGAKELDARADLWSLGVIAYRCVTGVLPFDGDALGELLVAICMGTYRPAGSFTPALPSSFDRWMTVALAVEPAQRFSSATALAQALADVAAERGGLDRTFDRALSVAPRVAPAQGPIVTAGSIDALAVTHASMPPSARSPLSDRPDARTEVMTATVSGPLGLSRAALVGVALIALAAVAGTAKLLRSAPTAAVETPAESAPPVRAPSTAPTPVTDASTPESIDAALLAPAPASPEAPRPAPRAPRRARPNEGSSADPGF
jgi:serine/threonine-protein kinase